MKRKSAIIAFWTLLILSFDQLSKFWVVEHLNLKELGRIDLAYGLNFQMAWNKGINFGLFQAESELSTLLLIAGLSLVTFGFLYAAFNAVSNMKASGLAISAGGALGNIIDRINYGAVADFINLSCCGIDNPWAFNIADASIFFGLFLFLLPSKKHPIG